MTLNPKRPPTDEFAESTALLKENLLAFADWFSDSFHDPDDDKDANFEDSIIQTLALANMAMIEALSVHYGRRINVGTLLEPVISKTCMHEEMQKKCPHNTSVPHDCGGK